MKKIAALFNNRNKFFHSYRRIPKAQCRLFTFLDVAIVSIFLLAVSACNMPGSSIQASGTLNVTQAYQTIEARLTQAVSETQASTPEPTPTSQPTVATNTASVSATATISVVQPSKTAIATKSCDLAGAGNPIDVTIPDDTVMNPGQTFTKIWRLQNVGTCTWTQNYSIAVFSGEKMNAPASVPMPGIIAPGQTVDISVDLVAPQPEGTYQGNWKLRNASQAWFGIGPAGSDAFWVRIKVQPLPTLTPTQAAPTTTATPGIQASGVKTLVPGDGLNLDNNQLNSGSGDDIQFVSGENEQHLLVPSNGAVIGLYGPNQPSLGACQASSKGNSPIILNNLSPGLYLCYTTNLNLTGWLLLNNFDAENLALTIEYLTWITP
ncbi:MAG TPA: NBR1-Ig-like domain-containing protein [Anaerolineales bacterium]|nr:NBR1-Ig-like domain-containing protein [Anaerolineales bacterium]